MLCVSSQKINLSWRTYLPAIGMSLANDQNNSAQLAENAASNGGSVWLTSPETGLTVTWADAQDRVQVLVGQLNRLGLAPREPVAIAAHNCIASTLLFTAVTCAGFVATPLNLVSGTKAMAYVLGHCQAKILFCAPDNRSPD